MIMFAYKFEVSIKTMTQKIIKILLFSLLIPVIQSAWANNTKYPEKEISFLLLGQSNMAGQGLVRELPRSMKYKPKNIRFYLNGSLTDMNKQTKFGPEVSFSRDMALAYPNKIINIIKFAPGGSLMRDWLSKGHHYLTLKKQLNNISKLTQINMKGVLWMQGERDTKSLELAKNYKKELVSFVKLLRADFRSQKLAFVVGRISVPEAYRPAVKEIKLAQEAVCSILPYMKIISTDGLAKNEDKVHYSTQGQLKLGHLFARKILTPK